MTQVSQPVAGSAVATPRPVAAVVADSLALTKPGIVRLVTVTSAVGFALAALAGWQASGPLSGLVLTGLLCLLGTALSAAGANALNQAVEARRDARMRRTMGRPIPAGRMTMNQGFAAGMLFSVCGVVVLWAGTNPMAALVSLFTIIAYVMVYTPLKVLTPLSTWAGAVPGALPPMIGWAAASDGAWRGLDQAGGWALFLIMFAWQIPHFLALAWKYRDDYARGGYRVLSLNDPTGLSTAKQSVVWSLVMVACSLLPIWAMPGIVGWWYGAVALVLGVGMVWLSIRLLAERTDANARRLFLGSILYLPVVLCAIVVDAAWNLIP